MLNTALTFEIDTRLNDEGIAVEALRPLFRRESQAKVFPCQFHSKWWIIDHFRKWRPPQHTFVFMLIRPTVFILKQIFF